MENSIQYVQTSKKAVIGVEIGRSSKRLQSPRTYHNRIGAHDRNDPV